MRETAAGARRLSASELGIGPGRYRRGPVDAITDVRSVRVGQVTLIEGSDIRTGVTAIVPDGVDRAGGELAAGLYVGNGFGKLIGATQLAELGAIETPIVLTGTLSAFRAADALLSYMLALPGNQDLRTCNPVVGETNDGYLSDIRARPVTERHVIRAIQGARSGPVEQGCVGAGTGTAALGFKAGIGTASRVIELADGESCTVGVLVQANFSGVLTVAGTRIHPEQPVETEADGDGGDGGGNSCMIIVALDGGFGSRQLTRIAKRAVFAMGAVGSDFAPGSGDYAIAFDTAGTSTAGTSTAGTSTAGTSTAGTSRARRGESMLGPVFAATAEATGEAIVNSLLLATTTTGYLGHVKHAVPLDFVKRAGGELC